MTKKIPKTNLLYAAGYIDGDGCFYIGKYFSKERNSYRTNISVVINSVNRPVLDFFEETFGGSVCLSKKEYGNRKPIYQYTAKKENGVILAKKVMPYLVEKQEEAELLTKFAKSKSLKTRMSIIDEMKNTKNVKNLVYEHYKKEFEEDRSTISPTKNDFAYLAGLIDSECNLGIQKYKSKNKTRYYYKIILQCNNTKAPIFRWLLQRFGGQIHFIDRITKGTGKRNQLTWRLSSNALSKILPDICPFLKHKKPVCEELMKFYETTLKNGGARHTKSFADSYAQTLKIREEIVSRVHKLNLKGIKPI